MLPTSPGAERYWNQLYWMMRTCMALLWLWTAYVSWFVFPHDTSIQWLQTLGITQYTGTVLMAACILDAAMGLATAFWASRTLWLAQIATVIGYTLAICWGLPDFLFEPFGPVTKNFAVVACLLYLRGMEDARV